MSKTKNSKAFTTAAVFIPIMVFFSLFFAMPSLSEGFFGVSVKNPDFDRSGSEIRETDSGANGKPQAPPPPMNREEAANARDALAPERANEAVRDAKANAKELSKDSESIRKAIDFLNNLNERI